MEPLSANFTDFLPQSATLDIKGVVVVEQTTNAIRSLKNKVIEASIGMTILFFLFGGMGILLFVFRSSLRIGHLRN